MVVTTKSKKMTVDPPMLVVVDDAIELVIVVRIRLKSHLYLVK